MSDDLAKIVDENESAVDTQVAKLENDLQSEKDSRKTERFAFCLAFIILFDCASLKDISWIGWIPITFFEILLILVLATVCGVEDIYTKITTAIDATGKLTAFRFGRKDAAEDSEKPNGPILAQPEIEPRANGAPVPALPDDSEKC